MRRSIVGRRNQSQKYTVAATGLHDGTGFLLLKVISFLGAASGYTQYAYSPGTISQDGEIIA
jgi:hypothetical protein